MKHLKLIGLLAIACSAVLVLGACGKSQSQSNTTSSSSKQVQSSSSSQGKASLSDKVVNSSSAVSQPSPSSEVSQSSETEPSTEASSSPEAPAPSAPTTGGIDVNAIANGDFSSVAGTWQDDMGNQLTFDKDGLVSHIINGKENGEFILVRGSVSQGKYVATLGDKSSYASATMTVIPRGEKIPATEEKSSQEQILVGQDGVYAVAHPYYRVQ